jgi:PAS domain S-box-containing protein
MIDRITGLEYRLIPTAGEFQDVFQLTPDRAREAQPSARVHTVIGADRALANVLPQIIWTCDAQGQLEWVNDRWFEFTGLSEEETLREKGALGAVHPDDRDSLWQCWESALQTAQATELEYRIRSASGEYRWHFARVAPVRTMDGGIAHWVAAVLDIHDRRMGEEAQRASERQFNALFHVNPLPMAITRQSDGVFLLVNDAFTAFTGYSRDEVVGRSSVELGMVSRAARAEAAAISSGANGRAFELPVRVKDGRQLTLLLFSSDIEIDGVSCFVKTGIDLTQRRSMEDALRASEVQARAAEDDLRRANQQKDEFLAILSHELRTPLTPILTSARLLEGHVDRHARGDLEIIVHQVKHMARLVDDLLDVARITRGGVTLSKTRTEPAIAVLRAAAATTPLLQQRGHRLEIDIPQQGLAVEADGVRLTQIFDNLLSNAARYTPPGGIIRVSGRREGDRVALRVRDNGAGIEPSLLGHVFEMFVQGPRGADRAEGGLGLGLSLVRALTELHGGTVSVQSEGPGLGTEFTVLLPAAATDSRSLTPSLHSSASPSEDEGGRKRVLLVEDHPAVAEGLTRLLQLLGYDVRTERNPFDAIVTAESFRPEIALLDIGLPGMDGYSLAVELRGRLGDKAPVLIALSGYNAPLDMRHSQACGFATHLVKPIDSDDLVNAINSYAPGTA